MVKIISKTIKKTHHIIRFFIISLVVLIVVPIGLAYAFLYDSSTASINVVQEETEDIFNRIAIDSLDETTNDEEGNKIQLKMLEEDLNTVIYNFLSQKRDSNAALSFVKQAYINIDPDYVETGIKGKYSISFELTSQIFKTKLTIDLALQDNIQTEDNYENQYISLKIINVSIARAKGLDNIIKKVIKKDFIEKLFSDIGLHVEVDITNLEIKYNLVTAINDFQTLSGNDNMRLYSSLFIDALNQKMIDFDFYSDKSVSIGFGLSAFHNNDTYEDANKYNVIDLDSKADDLATLLNNRIIKGEDEAAEDETTYVQDVFEYLIHGYTYTSTNSEFINVLSGLDLSSIGIDNYETYEGIPVISLANPEYKEITQCVSESASLAGLAAGHVCQITEKQLNNYFRASPIIGSRTLLYRDKDTSDEGRDYKISYVCIDNLYCDIKDKEMDFVANINVNGYKTTVAFEEKYVSTNGTAITFDTDKIYLGQVEATEAMKELFFQLLETAFNSCTTFNARLEEKQVIIDFGDGINDSPISSLIPAGSEYEFVFDTTEGSEQLKLEISNE